MRDIQFRAWHRTEKKMYYRGYQKWFHVLLCEDDKGSQQGRGIPVKRAGYDECELLECTGIADESGAEIFEGDILAVIYESRVIEDVTGPVPDMFKSRGLHPLHSLLEKHGIPDRAENLKIRILGNRYEHPHLLTRRHPERSEGTALPKEADSSAKSASE